MTAKHDAANNDPKKNIFLRARKDLDISQESLSEMSMVSVQTIAIAESEPASLPLDELSRLANFLNLDPGEVFEFLHEQMVNSNQESAQ